MKKSLLLSLVLAATVTFYSNPGIAREHSKLADKSSDVIKEPRLSEILSSGYAYAFFSAKNGDELFCYGEVNKMSFSEHTNCHRVRATFDKVTGRPIEIVYLNR